jgi:hypothetical protein
MKTRRSCRGDEAVEKGSPFLPLSYVGRYLVFCVGLVASAFASDTAVKLTRLEDRVRIEIGGKLFSEYRYRGAPKPCLFPILDADGISYTPFSSIAVTRGRRASQNTSKPMPLDSKQSGTRIPRVNPVTITSIVPSC